MATESAPESGDFSKLLLDAVDHGLLTLGEAARRAIYDCIENSYQITREQIPEKLEEIHAALADLLGKGGSMVETIAAEKFHKSLHLNFEPNADWTLADYVGHVKRIMSTRQPRAHVPGS